MSSISKMLFTVADKLFYETLDRYVPNKQAFFDPVKSLLPANWNVHRSEMWFHITPQGTTLPTQGWKIHASATPANAKELLLRIVPVLVKSNIAFKFGLDPLVLSIITGKGWSVAGAGKFVTVYFQDEEQFVRVAEELHQATLGMQGPAIRSDRRYRDSKIIFYRYGGISPIAVLNAKGERVLVISRPDGQPVPDERLARFVLPEWIKDPFPWQQTGSSADPPTALKDGRYFVRAPLAYSSCGGVYLATDTVRGTDVVIKEARPLLNYTPSGADAVALLEREYRLLKKVEASSIAPRPLDFFREEDRSFLVEEYIANAATLRFYSGSKTIVLLTEPTREKVEIFWSEYKRIFLQVARLLKRLHELGIVFMDFSHNNVLVGSDGSLKLIDLEGAFESGTDAPSYLLTPGFASVADLNTAPGFANDYFAFGATMLSYIMPINAMLLLDPQAHTRFLNSIARDFGLPSELEQLITRLLSRDAGSRPSLSDVISILEPAYVTSAPEYKLHDDLQLVCRETVESTVQHMLASASYERSDRLFPADPKIFVTNPLNLAYGACGSAWAIHAITGIVPGELTEWMLKQKISHASYPPGLYLGTAGIAWVFKRLGFDQKAEELMRSTWNHPALMETHDMFYGLAGWGMAQLRFFLDTGNEEYLQQAIRAAEQLAQTAKQENDTCYWASSNNAVPVGFAHGASGVSLFLLYLHLVTGKEQYLDLGKKALDFDLAAAITNSEGSLTWQVRRMKGAPGVPYLRYGTAGVGLALVRYYRALGGPRYAEILDKLLPDVDRKYGIYPGRFIGLAGMGEFLLGLREIETFKERASVALKRLLTGISLFRIETAKGTAFPGYELYRFSCDYATGSAGIALFMHQYLIHQSGDFLLDEVFAPSLQAYSQSG